MIKYTLPLLGFCAYSGTGKTTLLRKLLPVLKQQGIRIAVIKHAHHSFDIDHPGKDSYELRKAGADQMLVASRQRIAYMLESRAPQDEPVLEDALAILSPAQLDLVLVEGFKQAAIPKIELYRHALGKPFMFTTDRHICAIASDKPLAQLPATLKQLDLNQPQDIAEYITRTFLPTKVAVSLC